jgi:beta-lactamase class A
MSAGLRTLLRVTSNTAIGLVMAVEAAAQAPPDPARAAAELRTSFERRLAAIAEGLDGVMGFSIVDLTSGDRFGRLADEPFPTASSIKIAILYELFKQAEEGRVTLDEPRPVPQAARAAGSGILQELRAPSMPLTDYATLMVVLSDNTATNLLIDALGMDRVNARMRALGLDHVWLQRRMIDTGAARRGLENLAWPNDLAALLDAVHRGRGLSPASRDAIMAILSKPKTTALTRGVPPGVAVASKPGSLEGVQADAGIVLVEGRPYVIVVMCSWLKTGRDGERAIEDVSRATYEYFSRLAQGGKYGRRLQ